MAYDSDPKNTETNLIENLGKIDFDFTTLKKSQTMMNVTSTDNLIPSDIIYSNEFDKFFGISKSHAPNIVMGQIMAPPLSTTMSRTPRTALMAMASRRPAPPCTRPRD